MKTLTDIAAWVGALTGGGGLLWDFIKYAHSGPRLVLSANPNMVPLAPESRAPAHLVVRVVNRGRAPTTVTVLAFEYFPSLFNQLWVRLTRRPHTVSFVPDPQPAQLPYKLEPGAEWHSILRPDPAWERAREGGRLYLHIEHTMSHRPCRRRVRVAAA
jgi:hypothetical protein